VYAKAEVEHIERHAVWHHISAQQLHPHTSAYVSIRQHTSAYVSIRQHTSAYVSIRQHTSAYVTTRQNMSAYVGIRHYQASAPSSCSRIHQHTLAYVGIRQHTSAYVTPTYASIRAASLSVRLLKGVYPTQALNAARVESAKDARLHPRRQSMLTYADVCLGRVESAKDTRLHPRRLRRPLSPAMQRRLHTSAYVSMRQHAPDTSAYVSIRQHTSAAASAPHPSSSLCRHATSPAYISIR
jgi:hypothetical protein